MAHFLVRPNRLLKRKHRLVFQMNACECKNMMQLLNQSCIYWDNSTKAIFSSVNTCVKHVCDGRLTAARVRVTDYADSVTLPAAQLPECAVGAAGVAGGDGSSAVHRRHHLDLVWARVLPAHGGHVCAAFQTHLRPLWLAGG